MTGDADLAALGSVLGDRARARMLLALGDGRALPAGVLASEAGVAASTASEHLSRLVDASCCPCSRRAATATTGWPLGGRRADRGAIVGGDGVHCFEGGDRLSAPGRDVDYRLTRAGARKLASLGVQSPEELPLRYCIDWTEQAHHLSGPLGRALAARQRAFGL